MKKRGWLRVPTLSASYEHSILCKCDRIWERTEDASRAFEANTTASARKSKSASPMRCLHPADFPSLIVLQELAVSTTISKRGPCIGGLPFHLKRRCTGYLLPRHPLGGEGTYIWGPESQLVHCRGDSCNDSLRPQLPLFCSDALPSSCPGLSAGCCARSLSSTNCYRVDASCGN